MFYQLFIQHKRTGRWEMLWTVDDYYKVVDMYETATQVGGYLAVRITEVDPPGPPQTLHLWTEGDTP